MENADDTAGADADSVADASGDPTDKAGDEEAAAAASTEEGGQDKGDAGEAHGDNAEDKEKDKKDKDKAKKKKKKKKTIKVTKTKIVTDRKKAKLDVVSHFTVRGPTLRLSVCVFLYRPWYCCNR